MKKAGKAKVKTIQVTPEAYSAYYDFVERRNLLPLKEYTSALLLMLVAKAKLIDETYPHLKKPYVSFNNMIVEDTKLRRAVSLTKRDNHIHCDVYNSFDCDHVKYALMLPELGRLG